MVNQVNQVSVAQTVAQDAAATEDVHQTVLVQLAKTKICQLHRRGLCNDDSCRFAHSHEELRSRPNLMKTSICRAFQKGKCRDENCKFAHGEAELRVTDTVYKTQLCVFHARGFCKKGNRCRHAHGLEEMQQQPEPKAQRYPQMGWAPQEMRKFSPSHQKQWSQLLDDPQEEVLPLQEQWSRPPSPDAVDREFFQQHQEPLLKPVPEPGKNAAALPWTPPQGLMKTPATSMAKTPSTMATWSNLVPSPMGALGSPPGMGWPELAEPQYVPVPEDLCSRFDNRNAGAQFGGFDGENMFGEPFRFRNSGTLRSLCRDLTEKLARPQDEDEQVLTSQATSPLGSAASLDSPSSNEVVAPSTPPRTPRQVLPCASPTREAIESTLARIMDSPTPWHPTRLSFEALSTSCA